MTRRQLLSRTAGTLALAAQPVMAQGAAAPNIIVIITDDQGYGDVAIHGNDKIRTPNMDRIAKEGAQFTQFHVCPVCSPTRASLMTGRYNYRTGVVDTYLGRSMMHADETTLPEILRAAGYRTGIFGKWHLGDNYPMRAMDQGFEESVVIRGGGLGQPSDIPGGGSYFDPILLHNGKQQRYRGYCTDIYTDEALRFIEANRSKPFFAYLAMNAPHTPLEVADALVAPYRGMGLDEATAKIYAMITNCDDNIGRVLGALDKHGIAENTVVIFMTDNGPQQKRYNAGMRGLKGSVHEGGTRVPFFVRWPAKVKAGSAVDRLSGHIDLLPTLASISGAKLPAKRKVDGRDLSPLLQNNSAAWPDRTMFFQWHRGDQPELYRASAARNQRWKLVDGKDLYDLKADPAESRNVAQEHPKTAKRLREEYEAWFRDVSAERGYDPPRIAIGTKFEDPVVLTRQDWRGPNAGWTPESVGYWEVNVAKQAEYEISVRVAPDPTPRTINFRLGNVSVAKELPPNQETFNLGRVRIPAGPARLEADVVASGKIAGVQFVEVRTAAART